MQIRHYISIKRSHIFSGVRVAQSVGFFCVVFCWSLLVLLSFFLLAIVLSVLLWFTASDNRFGIFKYFLWYYHIIWCIEFNFPDAALQTTKQNQITRYTWSNLSYKYRHHCGLYPLTSWQIKTKSNRR